MPSKYEDEYEVVLSMLSKMASAGHDLQIMFNIAQHHHLPHAARSKAVGKGVHKATDSPVEAMQINTHGARIRW